MRLTLLIFLVSVQLLAHLCAAKKCLQFVTSHATTVNFYTRANAQEYCHKLNGLLLPEVTSSEDITFLKKHCEGKKVWLNHRYINETWVTPPDLTTPNDFLNTQLLHGIEQDACIFVEFNSTKPQLFARACDKSIDNALLPCFRKDETYFHLEGEICPVVDHQFLWWRLKEIEQSNKFARISSIVSIFTVIIFSLVLALIVHKRFSYNFVPTRWQRRRPVATIQVASP